MSAQEARRNGDPAHAHGLRFVIADDSAVMRFLLRSVIESQGMEVIGEAADGIAAVVLVLERGADVVLLDVDLPGLDGFAAAELIEWQQPRTRLLLHAEDPSEATCRRAEALSLPLIDRLDLTETILEIAESRTAGRSDRLLSARRGRIGGDS